MNERPNIDTRWTQSLRRGEQPSHENLCDHLKAVHRDNAGFTESCASQCRDHEGRNSYELLADCIDPERHQTVLDLGCGSGVLLEICDQRFGSRLKLMGVDMSAEELALARARLPDASIGLHEGVAQSLPFIADASIDVVLCHWALTLMDDVPLVLAEVKRVLKPGGVFAAIVDGDASTAPGYADIHDLIYRAVQREYPDYGAIDLGDRRVRTAQALMALAAASFAGDEVRIKPAVLRLSATSDVLAREAAGFFYASFVLSPEFHQQMLEDLEAFFAGQGSAGRSRFSMPVNKLVVERTTVSSP
ncbi:MAG: class I SAM-dependent methyltransferase [Pseudomonadota bacterium]